MKRLLVVLFFLLGFFILVGCENDYNDDYVVIRDINGEIVKGKEDMDAFYERTKEGEKIRINYIDKYLEEGVERTYTFYIEYDGFYYVTNYQMYTNSPEKTKYKYLICSKLAQKEPVRQARHSSRGRRTGEVSEESEHVLMSAQDDERQS